LSSEGGEVTLDAEAVVKAVKRSTDIEFQVGKADRYPVPKERIKEFFWPANPRTSGKAPYVHVLWIDIDNTIHIETDILGDTMDMVEWIYGSGWLRQFRRMNLEGFEQKAEAWNEFKKEFPPVANRLLDYETVVSEISAKHQVPLEIMYHGSEGLASFRIEARIDSDRITRISAERAVQLAISALGEAFYKIKEHQKRLADAWGYLPGR
jgi:hypothetical protein